MSAAQERVTKTGGRDATTRRIPPELALAVTMPSLLPPSGWKWSALTELARLESGHTPSRKHPEYWGGDIPWISIVDAKNHHGRMIGDTIEKTNSLGIENSSARVLPAQSVCLSRTASVGYVVVMERPMATSQDFVNWVCSKDLVPEFLKYLFIAEGEGLLRFASGAVHQTIYFPEAKAFHICHPPVPEQRRIVDILDKALESIAIARINAEKNLQNARELFESQRDQVFGCSGNGYAEFNLGEVCAITSQFVDPREKEFADLLHVGAGNMQSDTGVLANLQTARDEKLISGKFKFENSAVLYSKIRPYLRKAARPDFSGLCSADVYPLDPIGNHITRDYLYHLLLSNLFTSFAIAGSARAGMPKVNRDHLFAFKCWLPKVEVQAELVAKLDRLEKETRQLEFNFQRKLAALDELKQSLLHQAFSGQL